MHLPIRPLLCAGLFVGVAACQTHDRVIYETRSPKNLRVPKLSEVPDVPLGAIQSTPTENPAAVAPSSGGPSAPAAAQ